MKVTQEKLPASQIGLEIEITPEMSKQAYEKTLQEFTRYANIPGFRKGKVPRQVLIQRFGSSRIKASALEELIQDSLRQAVEQEKIEAIGNFELRSTFEDLVQQFEPGSALTFSAAVDVPPDVKLENYQGLSVQAEEVKYDPEQVDKTLEDYRKRSATLVPVEGRPAQAEDIATVDFSGTFEAAEGEESQDIPGGSAEDFEIELVEGRFIPGFIDGIIGMAVGETKEVAVSFPENYPQADLAGKPAAFTITLKELKERELPELDDDFAQEISEFETLAELRDSLDQRYQKEAEEKTKANKQEALLSELVKYVEVDLPESMIRQEVDFSISQTAMRLGQQGMDVRKTFTQEIVSMLRQQARPEAITRLQRTLALGEIAKKESIAVTADEVTAQVQEILQDLPEGQDFDMERLRQVVEDDLLKDKILGWLEEHGTVELVPEGSLTPPPETEVEEASEAPEAEAVSVEVVDDAPQDATVDVVAETVVEATEEEEPSKKKKTKGEKGKSKKAAATDDE